MYKTKRDMSLLKTHETLATDAEVWRYYEIDERNKLKLYKDEPLPTEPRFNHNGCPRTELTVRMESFMSWNGHEKDSFRRRVKQELPELELSFQRISQEEIPKIEKAFNEAESVEFLSTFHDEPNYGKIRPYLPHGSFGQPAPEYYPGHTRYVEVYWDIKQGRVCVDVPVHWDVNKRQRFIDYIKPLHLNSVKAENQRKNDKKRLVKEREKEETRWKLDKKRLDKEWEEAENRRKNDKKRLEKEREEAKYQAYEFTKRLEKEQEEADYQAYKFKKRLEKEQEEAEYQAYKLIHTSVPIAVHIDSPTAVLLEPSELVVEARWA